ncbi:MAG: hypothetical protein RJB66_2021 [Pseudomonadota bacterium]|jgi:hypothetical protein
MTFWRNSLLLTTIFAQASLAFAQPKTAYTSKSSVDSSLFSDQTDFTEPRPSYTLAQILPAYKVALKKGMFEVMGGLGHTDGSEEINRGQPNYIKKSPQGDFVPVQLAYGLSDNTSLYFSGKAIRQTERATNTNLEGTSEPQFSISHSIRNENSTLNLIGTYTADVGAATLTSRAASRKEGNTLQGGASGEGLAGYFVRLSPIIIGGEVSYLYKDSRIKNEETIALFTGQTTGQTQTRLEGGNEKTLRAIVELAMPIRLGATAGRTWVEPEELITMYQPTTILYNSYYRNFFSGYARFQVNPKLAILPSVSYTEAPDTTGITGKQNQEIATQVGIRYRF